MQTIAKKPKVKIPDQTLDNLALSYMNACRELAQFAMIMEARLAALRANFQPDLRSRIADAACNYDRLLEAVRSRRSLFLKPQSQELHGIKFGWAKQKGRIEIPDPEQTVRAIKGLYADDPDLIGILIHTKQTPDKDGIADLAVKDAERIGCEIHAASEQPFVRLANSETDKTIRALLAEKVESCPPSPGVRRGRAEASERRRKS